MHISTDTKCSMHQMILLTAFALVLLSAVCVGSAGAWSADTSWGLDYASSSVFYINDAGDLAQFASMVNSGNNFTGNTVYLNADIDLQNQVWTPIGNSESKPFSGTFNGQGHTIDNVYIFYSQGAVAGLFGYVTNGHIRDLDIVNIVFDNDVNAKNSYLGSFAGHLHAGTLTNCSVLQKAEFNTQGNGRDHYTIGGLIGKITDSVAVTADNLGNYLIGDCFVRVANVNYNKPWGLLVGSPIIGVLSSKPGGTDDTGGTTDPSSATYVVTVYKMRSDGINYDKVTSDKYVVLTGTEVVAEYTIPEGYFLNDEKSCIAGTVTIGNILNLEIWYDLISYNVTIPLSLNILEDINTKTMSISVSDLRIPASSAVKVYVEGDFLLEHQTSSGITLAYVLKNEAGETLLSGHQVGQFTMADYHTLSLTAKVVDRATYSGRYSDTLTFTYRLETIA